MKINEKIRNFFIGFITALAATCGAVFYYFRKSANTVRDNDRQSAELTERVGREIEELGDELGRTSEQVRNEIEGMEERNRESESDYSAAKQTIAEIRKNQQILENNGNSSC